MVLKNIQFIEPARRWLVERLLARALGGACCDCGDLHDQKDIKLFERGCQLFSDMGDVLIFLTITNDKRCSVACQLAVKHLLSDHKQGLGSSPASALNQSVLSQ